jgi:hypothetical protein
MANPIITNLDGSNPGPAGISTTNTQALVGAQNMPNYGSGTGQGTNMLRLLAVGRAIPINTTGDVAFLPFINTTAFSFGNIGASATGAVLAANPIVGSTGLLGTAAVANLGLWAKPGGTGTSLVAQATLSSLTGATPVLTTAFLTTVAATAGYYTLGTTGNNPWGSNGVYVHLTAASTTATQIDLFIYGFDFS